MKDFLATAATCLAMLSIMGLFIVSRWWLYGWVFDHAPRWVSILVMGG